MQFNLRS